MPAIARVGSGGPPRPIATMTGSRPRRAARRATAPAIAVLPVRLPVPMTASVGTVKRRPLLGWVEPEVGTEVGNPGRQGDGDHLHPLAIAQHRLVGEVEDDLRRELGDRVPQGVHRLIGDDDDGHAEVGRIVAGGQLLGPTHEERGHDLVPALPATSRAARVTGG